MVSLLKNPASVVWLVLVSATAVSWSLGVDHSFADGGRTEASVAILAIAFVKVRFIGLYFMELRHAPQVLRGLFEAYCVVVCALVLGFFLLA